MTLKVGIVGLPNVGKSMLFNALCQTNIASENYPFTTIEPNFSSVSVPDPNLMFLQKHFKSQKIIFPVVNFIDIAGLIRGASTGAGLGNMFLSHIRNVNLICMVVRCFEDKNVEHVDGALDPIRDIETVLIEFLISDNNLITKRISKVKNKFKNSKKKDEIFEFNLLLKLKKTLDSDQLLINQKWTQQEKTLLKTYRLLTMKPFFIVANILEQEIMKPQNNPFFTTITAYTIPKHIDVIWMSVMFEASLTQLNNADQKLMLNEYNLTDPILTRLVTFCHRQLNLKVFYTAGRKEAKAWNFIDGWTAPKCGAVIHNDFKDHFIKVEVYHLNDLKKYLSEKQLKQHGLVRIEGKNYLMQNGDVCHFKIGQKK